MAPACCSTIIAVQQELECWFLEWSAVLRDWDAPWALTEDVESELTARPTGVAVLPALNEHQVARIGHLVEQFPLAGMVGVVYDLGGHLTRQVIQVGAAYVINVLIPITRYREVIQSVTRRSEELAYQPSLPPSPSAGFPRSQGPMRGIRRREDLRLVQLLCSPRTTAEIAEILFCSERSAYRRIRSLYISCGVRNRGELRELAARSGMASAVS
jgi:DNA-binding CsgD family transcriptional regulator